MSTFKRVMYSDECSPYTGLRYKRILRLALWLLSGGRT